MEERGEGGRGGVGRCKRRRTKEERGGMSEEREEEKEKEEGPEERMKLRGRGCATITVVTAHTLPPMAPIVKIDTRL